MTGSSLTGLGVAAALVALAALGVPGVRAAEGSRPTGANIHLRGRLDNCRIQFEKNRKGQVAFMGGSITEMKGYRPMVAEFLTKRFPKTEFTFTDAGISSTCSTTGAFRLATDVLSKGPVDLFFIEFAVNDDQDAAHARRECIRGMEGIVRHTRRHNPNADIVVTYFVNPGMLETIQAGKTPLTIGAHEAVAEHYGVPTVNLAKEVADRIAAGTLTWKKFGGTHPAPFGNAICTRLIEDLLGRAWSKPLPAEAKQTPHPMPPEPLDPLHYGAGRFIDPSRAAAGDGWTLGVPKWSNLKGNCRSRFAKTPMLCADRPGVELSLEFTGTAVGAYVLAGPDAGVAEASVDGAPPKQVNLYHRYSRGLHYPRTVMLATDLKPGRHTLRLRIAEKTSSGGHAMRILQFAAN